MKDNTKIILGIICGLIFVSLAGYGLMWMFDHKITTYTIINEQGDDVDIIKGEEPMIQEFMAYHFSTTYLNMEQDCGDFGGVWSSVNGGIGCHSVETWECDKYDIESICEVLGGAYTCGTTGFECVK